MKELSDGDYKEIGINIGKKKKIMAAVKEAVDKPAADAEFAKQEYEKKLAEHTTKVAERRLERRRMPPLPPLRFALCTETHTQHSELFNRFPLTRMFCVME